VEQLPCVHLIAVTSHTYSHKQVHAFACTCLWLYVCVCVLIISKRISGNYYLYLCVVCCIVVKLIEPSSAGKETDDTPDATKAAVLSFFIVLLLQALRQRDNRG